VEQFCRRTLRRPSPQETLSVFCGGGGEKRSGRAFPRDERVTPLPKTLHWQGDFGTSNFEGMTFGAAPPRNRACPENGPAWPTTQDGAASTISSRVVMPPNTSE
jgi:hypothetical protein